MPPDYTLYLVTDPEMTARRGLLATVAAAVDGGVTFVQLRDKTSPSQTLVETGRALRALLAPRGIPLVVNDRVEIARAIGADGVHLGQDDLAPAAARALLGPRALIGLSITAESQVSSVDSSVINYIGLGPVFSTATKSDAAPALGITEFAAIRRRLPCPVVAIGGLGPANAASVIAAGADGLAIVSAICAALDPCAAARELRAQIDAARKLSASSSP